MRFNLRAALASFLFGSLLVAPLLSLSGQQRLDLGVQLSPQVMYVRSVPQPDYSERAMTYTEGGNGVDIGLSVGAYLEYAVTPSLSLRGGVDMARRRYRYPVSVYGSDGTLLRSGINRVVYMAMELPFSVVYHFNYLGNNDRMLIGAGVVAARWVGIPQIESTTYRGSSANAPITYRSYSLFVFTGLDRYLSERFVLGIEPFISYSPASDVLELESRTLAVADLEFGLVLRVRFDN